MKHSAKMEKHIEEQIGDLLQFIDEVSHWTDEFKTLSICITEIIFIYNYLKIRINCFYGGYIKSITLFEYKDSTYFRMKYLKSNYYYPFITRQKKV